MIKKVQVKAGEVKNWMVSKCKLIMLYMSKYLSRRFNSLPTHYKKISLLVFGLAMGGISFLLIIQALQQQEISSKYVIDKISIPKDVYMEDKLNPLSDDQLIPVGKLKGEMDGEFEAFYLAVDRNGMTYINRSPEFSEDAYNKSNGWQLITRQALEMYKKQLHFLPHRSKGLKP
jgi:hypothetical protein